MVATYAVAYFLISVSWLLLFRTLGGGVTLPTLFRVFLSGLVAGPIAGVLSHALETSVLGFQAGPDVFRFHEFLLFFLIVGPVEEGLKFLAVFFTAYRRPDFRTSADGVLLAIAAALGFAGGENVLYLLNFGVEATLPRLFLGNLGHAAYAAFWGYALGVVLHEKAPLQLILAGLGIAALLHGAYDYLLSFSFIGAFLAFFLSGILWIFLFRLLHTEQKRNTPRRE